MSLTRTEAAIGSEAPDFSIANAEGSVRPADLKDTPVIVNFWSAKDAHSRERNSRLAREAAEDGKAFIGICTDYDRELARELVAQDGLHAADQYMLADVKKGDPEKAFQLHSGLRAFEINQYGNIISIIE